MCRLISVVLSFICLLSGCRNAGTDPAALNVSVRFWLSPGAYGPVVTTFARGDTIHFNYVMRNPGPDTVNWCMGDGGPPALFVVLSGRDTLASSLDSMVVPLNAPCGRILPHDSLSATWAGASGAFGLPPGDYTAVGSSRLWFPGNANLPGERIDFIVR